MVGQLQNSALQRDNLCGSRGSLGTSMGKYASLASTLVANSTMLDSAAGSFGWLQRT